MSTWRATRVEMVEKTKLLRAIVEETREGWTWQVWQGSRLRFNGGPRLTASRPMSKEEAIREAEGWAAKC